MNTPASRWERRTLGSITSPRKSKGIPNEHGHLPFIGMEHVESHTGRILKYGDSAAYVSAAPLVEPGDVLYGRLRPYLNKVALASERSFVSGEFIPLPGTPAVDSKFLQLRMLAPDFRMFTAELDKGDRPRVSWPQIASFEMLLPPLDEQRRIVAILEDHLSRLDAGSESIARALARCDHFGLSMHRSLLKSTSGIQVGLLEVCRAYQPKTIATKNLIPDGRFPVYGANGQIGFFNDFNHDQPEVTVTCRGATCGTVNVIPAPSWITGNAMVITPLDGRITKGYLEHVLRSVDYSQVITGTAQPQITRASLNSVTINLPDVRTQQQIAESLDEAAAAIRRLRFALKEQEDRSAKFRRSLLASAFSGQLTRESIIV